jgi:hypothetical protein
MSDKQKMKIVVSRDKRTVTGTTRLGTRTAHVGMEYVNKSKGGAGRNVRVRLVAIVDHDFVAVSTTSEAEKGHAHTGRRMIQMRSFMGNYVPMVPKAEASAPAPKKKKDAEVTRISDAAVLAEMRKIRDQQTEILSLVRALASAWKVDGAQEG